ncbi:40S ribosomal protein S19-3 [Abeliophyllum distichum]|uniref:40S ribosomal protein S19-3 n=2 Tax=Forsythieae TaxID=426104 RepID=A0ABD1SJL1_9LAMI
METIFTEGESKDRIRPPINFRKTLASFITLVYQRSGLVSFCDSRSAASMATAKTVKDVSPHEFVKAYAAHLKRSGKMELPEWTDIVKTGVLKELAPYDPDWYYIRAASMARKIYLRGGLGVGAFRRIYGGSKRNGSRPPHFCKSSGSVARHVLQQLQTMNIIDMDTRGGRKITSSGRRDLDQVAGRIVVVAP